VIGVTDGSALCLANTAAGVRLPLTPLGPSSVDLLPVFELRLKRGSNP
jgi:hypothetical protein